MNSTSRDDLFTKYGVQYGARAEAYARGTFSKWGSGATTLSGQTMERLIQLVPPYLSPQKRYSLLEVVVNIHKKSAPSRPSKVVCINTEAPHPGISEINKALSEMKMSDPLAHVPEYVMKTATWLYDDDITVARAMLAQAESLHNESIKASAIRDMQLILNSISAGQIKTASYRVPMPSGTLEVQIFTPKKGFWQNLFG